MEAKYLKYKSKYLKLMSEGNLFDKEEIESLESDLSDYILGLRERNASDNPINTIKDSYDISIIDDTTSYVKSVDEETSLENLDIVMIGYSKTVKGRKEDLSYHSKNLVTINETNLNKDSVLYIRLLEDFDELTKQYGTLGNNDDDPDMDFIYLDWLRISDKYKGLYISQTLLNQRYENSPFRDNGKIYISWWINDFNVGDNVIVFI